MLHHRDQLARVYAGTLRPESSTELEEHVKAFFTACNHLGDWLRKDPPPGVTPADVKNHFRGSSDLKLCNAVSNTDKHHTRDNGITARIREVVTGGGGARVSIEVNWAETSAYRIDALDLANDCVASWEAFFAAYRVTPPT